MMERAAPSSRTPHPSAINSSAVQTLGSGRQGMKRPAVGAARNQRVLAVFSKSVRRAGGVFHGSMHRAV